MSHPEDPCVQHSGATAAFCATCIDEAEERAEKAEARVAMLEEERAWLYNVAARGEVPADRHEEIDGILTAERERLDALRSRVVTAEASLLVRDARVVELEAEADHQNDELRRVTIEADASRAHIAELEAAIEKAYVALESSAKDTASDIECATLILEASDILENVLPRLAVIVDVPAVSKSDPKENPTK